MTDDQAPDPAQDLIRFGWEEWVALPDLGLPALKAKVDTGARTSALHAYDIETFGSSSAPRVRFTVHPVPGRDDLIIPCSAKILDRRMITSSNGESESRYVIGCTIEVGGDHWPIELTLTNRGAMNSRMLLGREALKDHITIVATDRFLQPQLSLRRLRLQGGARRRRRTGRCGSRCLAARATTRRGGSSRKARSAGTRSR